MFVYFLFKFTSSIRLNYRELIRSEGSRTAGANPFYGARKTIFRVRRTHILGSALDAYVNSDVCDCHYAAKLVS